MLCQVESLVPCTPAPSPSDKESLEAHPPVEATGTPTSVLHTGEQAGLGEERVAIDVGASDKTRSHFVMVHGLIS